MLKIENSIGIRKQVNEVYQKALGVEDYPKFAANYLESKIVGYHLNNPIIRRAVKLDNRSISWKTEMLPTLSQDLKKELHFKTLDGFLAGMQTRWILTQNSQQETTLKIIHMLEKNDDVQMKSFFENRLVAFADNFLKDFKKWCEKND